MSELKFRILKVVWKTHPSKERTGTRDTHLPSKGAAKTVEAICPQCGERFVATKRRTGDRGGRLSQYLGGAIVRCLSCEFSEEISNDDLEERQRETG